MQQALPIDDILPQLKQAVAQNASVVLHAPPGAGKTTRVPLALLETVPKNSRIIMLEPRRIAAVSAARWMARSLNEEAGETIGYSIRFDSKISPRTRIEAVTEGILTRRIQSDPGLEDVSLVIFDEFHERSIHADLALALCLDVRKQLRPDLKILVMSATLQTGPIAALLGNAPIVSSSGKFFPVEERYLEQENAPLPARVKSAVMKALRETHGDILVFLPGGGEIRSCTRELQGSINAAEERVEIHPLYGDLTFEDQERALLPRADRRKIVLATNIAETSLTIQGVHVVVDSGLARKNRYDPSLGMNRLVTVPVSRASAQQRKGRAGRNGPGFCYRLYGQQDLQGWPEFSRPEILESDLSSLALELAAWGVKDPAALSWLDPPADPSWMHAVILLRDLGAVDRSGSITPLGRSMVRLPLHPRLSRMLLRAGDLNCPQLGADLAALLSERDIFRTRPAQPGFKDPDLSERLDLLNAWRSDRDRMIPERAGFRALDRTSQQLLRLMGRSQGANGTQSAEQADISRLLLSAFPDRIARRRDEGGGGFVLVQGRGVRLSRDSHMADSPFIIAVAVDAGERTEGRVHIAAPVSEDVIRNELTLSVERIRKIEWDRKEGRVVSVAEERIGALLLAGRQFTPEPEQVIPVVCDAIRSHPGLLMFNDEARQFQARVALVRRAFPEETWPDLSAPNLLARPEDWITPWLGGIRNAQALRALDLMPALKAKLNWEQQRLLDERVPLTLNVPSGSRVKLDYTSGEEPVLPVKLQEMFGLADTPSIAEGRVSILLHLLSPARRPVQITRDLKGFWNTGYPLVKKDLKGRYPKHPWPDDPWNAQPTRHTKKRGT